MTGKAPIRIPAPRLQIDFSYALAQIRGLYLQDALSETVSQLKVSDIDAQLSLMVPAKSLSALAKHGLRGELLFPVPAILAGNPMLLGYYRLLLGFSKKAFYSAELGLASFKNMEEKGVISDNNRAALPPLCQALISSAADLLDGIGHDRASRALLDDLTLLTLGPQLRGGANVAIGALGIVRVFEAIQKIVGKFASELTTNSIHLVNAAGRRVLIEFAPDPDIILREEMAPNSYRNIIAIEVKAGADFSNIHNRLGEAEKSHQKARNAGYVECWTVVNVDRLDLAKARAESPTTNRFYRLSEIEAGHGDEFTDFHNRIVALAGIPNE